MAEKAALLLNLGSPDSPSVPDVRRYLREFLSDPRVLDAPAPIRALVLNAFILPFRPKQSAEAYETVWTDKGSPLLVMSERQREAVAEATDIPIYLAMRYGQPSIPDVIRQIIADGVKELFVMPLYPQYAMSSYETVLVRVMEILRQEAPEIATDVLQPFYNDAAYLDALADSARPYVAESFDQLVISFHGVPERHLRKSDPSHDHCLSTPDCCENCHPAHATCYRHQCLAAAAGLIERLGLSPDQYRVTFQSRLGRDPWLTPFTDQTLEYLAENGTKRVLVMCPAFITDCLETLEEIAVAGEESFKENGGESLQLIPCLNDDPTWIQWLVTKIEAWQAGSYPERPLAVLPPQRSGAPSEVITTLA